MQVIVVSVESRRDVPGIAWPKLRTQATALLAVAAYTKCSNLESCISTMELKIST
jgi:hypothetical protein